MRLLRSLLMVLLSLAGVCTCVAGEPAPSGTHARQPIATAAALDRYLAETRPGTSPLDRLSSPAKHRFVDDFRNGFFLAPDDLDAELTRDEALALLKLFGAESAISALHPRPVHVALGASETPDASVRFDTLRKASRASDASIGVAQLYASDYAPKQSVPALRTMTDGDVALMFRAALVAVYFDPHVQRLDEARLDLAELERRRAAPPAWFARIYSALVERRDFAEAHRFAAAHPQAKLTTLPPLREAVEGDGPTVLAIESDGRALVHRALALNPSAQVIVVAGCHFAMDAAHDIDADADLKRVFSRNVAWITPSDWNPADADLVRWNRTHPSAPIGVVYRASEWPMIDSWAMPTFYFLREGRVAAKVVGWQGHREDLLAGFRAIGLAP